MAHRTSSATVVLGVNRRPGAARGRDPPLKTCRALWYRCQQRFGASGNNSVVECDLAMVEVAGSNPVSRSIFCLPEPPALPS